MQKKMELVSPTIGILCGGHCLEGQEDLVSKLRTGRTRVTVRIIRVINLLTKFP